MIPEHDTFAKYEEKYRETDIKMSEDSWYYGKLSRAETESIFKSANFDCGVYLLRRKHDGEIGKNYVLSIIRTRDVVKNLHFFTNLPLGKKKIYLDHVILYQYFKYNEATKEVEISYGLSRRQT